jgi:serine/threonine protein kinase
MDISSCLLADRPGRTDSGSQLESDADDTGEARAAFVEDPLAIFSLAIRLSIPCVNLNRHDGIRVEDSQLPDDQAELLAYALGSGATCVVTQHETDGGTSHIMPPGTKVAMKRYLCSKGGKSSDERRLDQQLYRQVSQELAVCSHPYLRAHENISKVKYLCWEDRSLVPILALELAEHGTLEHLLSNTDGLLLTDELRSHLSLDIVTGLAALHACDFVHGDVKPANIVVHRHKERQLLAQWIDFAGAGTVTAFGTAGHLAFHTNEWLAPEVAYWQFTGRIDWQKADVFSTGLVLAHLWWPEELAGKCFLDMMVPEKLKDMDKCVLYLIIKVHRMREGDHLITSYLNRRRRLLRTSQHHSESGKHHPEPLGACPIQLNLCLNKALARDVNLRAPASELAMTLHESRAFEARTSPGTG